jgi:hypothetical protein
MADFDIPSSGRGAVTLRRTCAGSREATISRVPAQERLDQDGAPEGKPDDRDPLPVIGIVLGSS